MPAPGPVCVFGRVMNSGLRHGPGLRSFPTVDLFGGERWTGRPGLMNAQFGMSGDNETSGGNNGGGSGRLIGIFVVLVIVGIVLYIALT